MALQVELAEKAKKLASEALTQANHALAPKQKYTGSGSSSSSRPRSNQSHARRAEPAVEVRTQTIYVEQPVVVQQLPDPEPVTTYSGWPTVSTTQIDTTNYSSNVGTNDYSSNVGTTDYSSNLDSTTF